MGFAEKRPRITVVIDVTKDEHTDHVLACLGHLNEQLKARWDNKECPNYNFDVAVDFVGDEEV